MAEVFALARDRELVRVAYLIKHPEVVRAWGERLAERHFEYVPARLLFLLVRDAVERHGEAPSVTEMLVRIESSLEVLKLENALSTQVLQDCRTAYDMPSSGTTGDDIAEWISSRELQDLGRDMTMLTAEQVVNRLPEIQQHLDKLRSLTSAKSGDKDLGISLFSSETLSNLKEFVDVAGGTKVPLGYPRLDYRMNGGPCKGEMMLIACQSGVGKSMMIFNMLLGCVLQNRKFRALYLSIGDARDGEMALRSLACASQVPLDTEHLTAEDWASYQKKIETAVGGANDNFWIKQYPPHRVSAQDLQRYIRSLKDYLRRVDIENGVPEDEAGELTVVGFDYPDLMLLEDANARTPEHEKLKKILEQCLAVCKEEDVVGIAVTQVNALGYKSDDPSPTQLAGALAKIDCVSHLFFYKQSDEEEELGRSRLYNWKSRRLHKKYVLPMRVNIRTQTITEDMDREPWTLAGEKRKKKGTAAASSVEKPPQTPGTLTKEERAENFQARAHAAFTGGRSAESPLNALAPE